MGWHRVARKSDSRMSLRQNKRAVPPRVSLMSLRLHVQPELLRSVTPRLVLQVASSSLRLHVQPKPLVSATPQFFPK